MVPQRLTPSPLLAAVLTVAVMAGCASAPPPRAPTGPPASAERPVPEVDRPPAAPAPPARPAQDARAPTLALVRQSERSAEDGDLEGAIAYVERAIRLNSRDPALWLRLARLQLAAERPSTAEQMAHKAIALSTSEAPERREAWLVVADALEAQGDSEAAAQIRARWRTYRG